MPKPQVLRTLKPDLRGAGSITEEAYNELLRGDGYHLLRGLISLEEAAAVRELALSRLHEGADQNGQIAIRDILHWGPAIHNMVNHPKLLALGYK